MSLYLRAGATIFLRCVESEYERILAFSQHK